jgi:hypothetical protein
MEDQMNKQWWKIGVAAALAAILGLASLSAVAFAQSSTPGSRAGNGMGGYGMGGRMGGPQSSLVATAAQTLGVTQADLVAELNAGQTLAQVAQAHGSSASALVEAWVTARQAALNQAVTAGQMTQAQADTMLANMRANGENQVNSAWTPKGRGAGQGFVDANGDGVCDYNTGQTHMPRGRGQP